MTYIAYALNNSHYMRSVYFKEGFQNFEEDRFPDPSNHKQVDFILDKLLKLASDPLSVKILHDPDNHKPDLDLEHQ